jgi:hypothetical protein
MRYGYRFKKIKRSAVDLSAAACHSLWNRDFDLTEQEKYHLCWEWVARMADIYNVPRPSFSFDSSRSSYESTGGGLYSPGRNGKPGRITLFYKFSFVTLAHEFRHHLQHHGFKMVSRDVEVDARAWSVSLLRLARPAAYRRATKKGLLHFS